MIEDAQLLGWTVGENETCKNLNLLELRLNFRAGSFNRCLTGL